MTQRIRTLFVASLTGMALSVPGAALAAGDGVWRDGADVYSRICQYCHEAGVSPELKGRELTLDYIQPIVRNGFRAMPAFRSSFIDDKSLAALADYLEKSEAGPSPPPPAAPPSAGEGKAEEEPGGRAPRSPPGSN